MAEEFLTPSAARALLEWQIAMGADEAIGDIAIDRLAPMPIPLLPNPALQPSPLAAEGGVAATKPAPSVAAPAIVTPPEVFAHSLADAAQSARALAAGAATIEALAALVAQFDGCPLKRTATNTVFIDG